MSDGDAALSAQALEAIRDALLDLVPAGVFWADPMGSCTYVNDQFCLLTDRTREELLGFGYRDAIHPDDLERVFPLFQQAVEARERTSDRLRFVGPNDVWASIDLTAVTVGDRVIGYLATALDITEQRESEQRRHESETLLQAINDRAPIGICMVDHFGNALSANPRVIEILGTDPTGRNLMDFVLPEDLEIAVNTSIAAIEDGRSDYTFSVRFPRPDGSIRHSDVHCRAIVQSDGEHSNSVIAVIDNTEAVMARRDSERYAELLAALTDFVALCDTTGRVTYLNRVAQIAEKDLPSSATRRLADFFKTTSRGRLISEAWPEVIENRFWQGELVLAPTPTVELEVSVSLALHTHHDGERTVSVVARDITDIKAAQRALEIQATHDPLTGLPNRALLFDRVEHALQRSYREAQPIVLSFVDLDGFKRVNDRHGHDTGDEVLRGVASRLLDVVRSSDTVARIGGDEFVILSEGLPDSGVALGVADRIVERISQPFAVSGTLASIGASVGVAYGTPTSTVEGLVKQADLAVYEAKRSGRGRVVVYDEALRRSA